MPIQVTGRSKETKNGGVSGYYVRGGGGAQLYGEEKKRKKKKQWHKDL